VDTERQLYLDLGGEGGIQDNLTYFPLAQLCENSGDSFWESKGQESRVNKALGD
jgi:hypothetical protein